MQKFRVELTDTFGGEANYAWVRRAEIEVEDNASQFTIASIARKAIGIRGTRSPSQWEGDILKLDLLDANMVCFVIPAE